MTKEEALLEIAFACGENLCFIGIDQKLHIPRVVVNHPDPNIIEALYKALGGTIVNLKGDVKSISANKPFWRIDNDEGIKLIKELQPYIIYWMKECGDKATRETLKAKFSYAEETKLLWRQNENHRNT